MRGTVKAASLQHYLSEINGFYRDLGTEPVAQGNLIGKASATVTDWLQLVAHMLEENPPPGFVLTSHSLRKGAAVAAYTIGVVLQNIKHFGGWAEVSSVVLNYINPMALPCAASWQLFGWLTHDVGRQQHAARSWAA
eukprot:jgi/Tetstr1/426886/TSEL_017099.t1